MPYVIYISGKQSLTGGGGKKKCILILTHLN